MWATTRNKFSNFLEKVARMVHLDAKKTLTWYSYILFVIPLLFWLMIELRAIAIKQSIQEMMKQPTIAIGILIAIVDFVVGYYLLLRKKDILASYEGYRFFMMWQAVCQILVGNLLCFVLALIGIHEAKKLENGHCDVTVKYVSVISGLFLVLAFSFIIQISFR